MIANHKKIIVLLWLIIGSSLSCAQDVVKDKVEIIAIPLELSNTMRSKGVWQESCPLKIEDLALLQIPYYDFEGNVRIGKLIILRDISDRVAAIFNELFQIKFPIYGMDTIDKYNGDDARSMDANNTYGFSCRKTLNSDQLSPHSFGIAIDINPLQNPYIDSDGATHPKRGAQFLDRSNIRPGMVNDDVIRIFQQNGFEWGGNWKDVDYHHFQLDKKYWSPEYQNQK